MAFMSHCLGECIIYIPDHCVLFCTKHQSAILLLELKYHLRVNRDHKLSPAQWQPIVKAAEAIGSELRNSIAELDIPHNGSEPLSFLPLLDGVRCLECRYLRGTRNDDGVLKAHIEKNHSSRAGEKWQDYVEEVKVQRWVADTRGTYWVVDGRSLLNLSTSIRSKTSYELAMEALEAEEDMEIEEDAKRNQQEDDTKSLDKSTPWLKHYTKWPTRFKGRPLNILAITKKPPLASPNSRRTRLTAGTH
jgi:hypothetical protein